MPNPIYTIVLQLRLNPAELARIESYSNLSEDIKNYRAAIVEYLEEEKFNVLQLTLEQQ